MGLAISLGIVTVGPDTAVSGREIKREFLTLSYQLSLSLSLFSSHIHHINS